MIISKLITKILPFLLKEVWKAVLPELKPLQKYVYQKNELDEKIEEHEDRIKKLEIHSHPVRDFVRCEKCEDKVKTK